MYYPLQPASNCLKPRLQGPILPRHNWRQQTGWCKFWPHCKVSISWGLYWWKTTCFFFHCQSLPRSTSKKKGKRDVGKILLQSGTERLLLHQAPHQMNHAEMKWLFAQSASLCRCEAELQFYNSSICVPPRTPRWHGTVGMTMCHPAHFILCSSALKSDWRLILCIML